MLFRALNEGNETKKTSSSHGLLTTPSRFSRIVHNPWPPGDLPDLICFTVDRNISILGCCSFGGYGLSYELDLYDFSDEKNPRSMQKLNGTFNRNDLVVDGIFQLKFAN